MNPLSIIEKYYSPNSLAYNFLVPHSQAVTKKALEIAIQNSYLDLDLNFIKEAGMLHDIGIILTNAPKLGCFGKNPYICHGYLGRELLEKEGLPKHALVCERHVGVGISLQDIEKEKLPFPKHNMQPVTPEEIIICLADKFFSKSKEMQTKEKTIEQIRLELINFGAAKVQKFNDWLKKYHLTD